MQAFHNDISIKEKLINQLQAHYDADEIVKGVYWKDGKGCAIGCAIHSDNHYIYEKRFGMPKWLAKVQDIIFEGLPNSKAKEWPINDEFMLADVIHCEFLCETCGEDFELILSLKEI